MFRRSVSPSRPTSTTACCRSTSPAPLASPSSSAVSRTAASTADWHIMTFPHTEGNETFRRLRPQHHHDAGHARSSSLQAGCSSSIWRRRKRQRKWSEGTGYFNPVPSTADSARQLDQFRPRDWHRTSTPATTLLNNPDITKLQQPADCRLQRPCVARRARRLPT